MNYKGFTLAEVLITLVVIGIVTMLTMPVLIEKYKITYTVSKLKRDYSIFNEAFRLAIIDNGDIQNWGLTNLNYEEDSESGEHNFGTQENMKSSEIFMNAIKPYLKLSKICPPSDSSCMEIKEGNLSEDHEFKLYSGILHDGTSFYLSPRSSNCKYENTSLHTSGMLCGDLTIDINGPNKGENKWGIDIFRFSIVPTGITARGNSSDKLFPFSRYCYPMRSSSSTSGEGCTGWVIDMGNMDYLKCDDLSYEGKHKCN